MLQCQLAYNNIISSSSNAFRKRWKNVTDILLLINSLLKKYVFSHLCGSNDTPHQCSDREDVIQSL
jgi:hypothetical protein